MLGESMTWRQATPADFESLRDIYDEVVTWLYEVKGITGQWDRPIPDSEIQLLIDSKETFLAFIDGQAVGAVRLSPVRAIPWEDRQDQALYVHSLAVKRNFAGHGVGTTMLQWAENLARESGKRFLRLECWVENPRLRRYYSEAGFRDLGQHPQFTWYALFEKEIA